MKASNPPFPQRAFVDTLSVEDGAETEEERVEVDEARFEVELDLVLDRTLDEAGADEGAGTVHVPNFELHPVPQYALVFPQYPY